MGQFSLKTNSITKDLIHWFEKNQRNLPWRKTRDPYAIWISEIMLQQTRVDTVIEYYKKFLNKFTSIKKLSEAKVDQVLKLWEGLGYYSRARNILKAAKIIKKEYHGKFPNQYEQIIRLPGIGKYTAGAILSIAFGKKVPAVDGNVLRVISRLFCIQKSIDSPSIKKKIEKIVLTLMPENKTSMFTQGLMELGALICIPENPCCLVCPVHKNCVAFQKGLEEGLPRKEKKAKPKKISRFVAVIYDSKQKKILMNKRTGKGVLSGLWEFPGVEAGNEEEFKEKFIKSYKLRIKNNRYWMDVEHVFTHLHWKMKVCRCEVFKGRRILPETLKWVSQKEMERLTIPSAFRKIKQKLAHLH